MLGRERTRQVALPRQIAMYLMREEGNISLPQIGEALGGRDHTTVMYGCDKISDLLERDDHFRRQVLEIREQLYGQVCSTCLIDFIALQKNTRSDGLPAAGVLYLFLSVAGHA